MARPSKPPLTSTEHAIALQVLQGPGPNNGLPSAALAISRHRASQAKTPAALANASVSPRWLQRQLAQGSTVVTVSDN